MLDLSEHLGEGVQALVTNHERDFSLPEGVDAEAVFSENQQGVLSSGGVDSNALRTIRQVHGATVLRIDKDFLKKEEGIPEADGVVTNLKDVILSIRTADCVPVFLYDPICQAIGLVHAGWKSTRQEIVSAALKEMSQGFGSCPADLNVVFGPSIHQCCYQVKQDFCDIFSEHMILRQGDWFLDLLAVNMRQLMNDGVRRENIYDSGMCTCCNDQFFSFRRDGERAGRHLSLLRIKG